MKLRYPDKPYRRYEDALLKLDDGTRVCQQKLDGWACLLAKDRSKSLVNSKWYVGNHLLFLSRQGNPLPIGSELLEAASAIDLPDQSMLVVEWMKRRCVGAKLPECVYVHDVYWLSGEWLGRKMLVERSNMLDKLVVVNELVRRPEEVSSGFVQFYKKQTTIPYTEGVVIKSKSSFVIGGSTGSKDNPMFVKVKWRE